MAKGKRPIEQYEHKDKERVNNPPVGLVTEKNDLDSGKKAYAYDPHIDPTLQFDSGRSEIERIIDSGLGADSLDAAKEALEELKNRQEPYLNWAGKAERTTFDVPTVSLHVHERIDPHTIIEAVRKKNGDTSGQLSFFNDPKENPPIREAIQFYKHTRGWSNRLIAGDSLLVMNSLLQKEGLAGQVQMVYIDPPYGIRYGSNFQPFVNKRDVKDGKDEDLTAEPETLKAFRDTWELGIHSYLTYLRDRLLLAKELLADTGSVFVQIGDENRHIIRNLMDEVLGPTNFCTEVSVVKTAGQSSGLLPSVCDYLIWYAKDKSRVQFRQPYRPKTVHEGDVGHYSWLELPNGMRRSLTKAEREGIRVIPEGAKLYAPTSLISQGETQTDTSGFEYARKRYNSGAGNHWKTHPHGRRRLARAERVHIAQNSIRYVRYLEDFPAVPYSNFWDDTATGNFTESKVYVVQTAAKILERCLLMTTDPGDLVLDITCGSGTTAYVAEQWGRRWITCDTSRVALTLAKQRLMTSAFEYYKLAHPEEGVGSGLEYKTVPHITLKSIANNEEIDRIYERNHPGIEEALSDLNSVLQENLQEWELPFDFPEKWAEEAKEPFERFHKLRLEMRKKMGASIQRNADQETLYDQPLIDKSKARVTGPFTVESVPAAVVMPLDELEVLPSQEKETSADQTIGRSGETLRQSEWRGELFRTGVRGKGGQHIHFTRIEPLAGTTWLHADGETKEDHPKRVVVSFGPEHAPLEQRQVGLALEEASKLVPKPELLLFAAFQFDPEAAKDIDETDWPGVTLLKVQMNADLLTEDLKKKRASNESFWLVGQPDVRLKQVEHGEDKGKYMVEVSGFDYYNTRTGVVESGGTEKIALWMLDTDYDGRSIFPSQVFFPMAGDTAGWARLARSLKAEIDPDLIEAYRGTISLPFEKGKYCRVAVKIVDDRGIESLKLIEVK